MYIFPHVFNCSLSVWLCLSLDPSTSRNTPASTSTKIDRNLSLVPDNNVCCIAWNFMKQKVCIYMRVNNRYPRMLGLDDSSLMISHFDVKRFDSLPTLDGGSSMYIINRREAELVSSIHIEAAIESGVSFCSFMAASTSKVQRSSPDLSVRIERNPSTSRLSELGIYSWPKWGCPPGKYMLRFEAEETFYLLRGRVKVHPRGSSWEAVEFGAGDLVTIPKGLSCTWDISVAVDKHYKFQSC